MTTDEKTFKIALAGNPNSGKSTIFNAITGARQHVANYAGVTVEIKEGSVVRDGVRLDVVDLPGTYSLSAYSAEELVAREYIVNEKPDVVIAVVDASNLERNLYLVVQLMELGAPIVIALNMMDIAEKRGLTIDIEHLAELIGLEIIPTVGYKGLGVDELAAAAVAFAKTGEPAPASVVRYGRDVKAEIAKLEELLAKHADRLSKYPLRWLALGLLEEDAEAVKAVRAVGETGETIVARAAEGAERIKRLTGASAETFLADRRYGFISGACQEAVRSDVEARHIFSDKVDVLATHPVLGVPILLALMYVAFYATFKIAMYPSGWIGAGRDHFAAWLAPMIPEGVGALTLKGLILNGIIEGVGGVVQFLPQVMVLFFAIAALEDTGYMARAAFVMDRFMHKMGLHGKSFIPMILGFGCTVPAILATRIVENRRDRLTTILVVPLMSCAGKLPTYALLTAAFFTTAWQGPVMWFVYVFGILLAVFAARLLKSTILKGESHPFVMELPPYRMPTIRGLSFTCGSAPGSSSKRPAP